VNSYVYAFLGIRSIFAPSIVSQSAICGTFSTGKVNG
jgi:hypothetical protein